MSTENKKAPGNCDTAFPEVYHSKPPPFPKELKPGQFTKEQYDHFWDQGYVLIDKYFTDDEMSVLEEAREGIRAEVDKLAQKLYDAGKIKKLYKEYGLFERLIHIDKEYPGTNILLHKIGQFPKNFRAVWSHPKLLNLAEQVLGTPNINGSPNWNLRVKTPNTAAATVPWHQDNGYDANAMYGQMVLTGWIPFLNTNENNGCMQVAKNGHKTGKIATHKCCWRDTWYVELDDEEMAKKLGVDLDNDIVTCPVPYGGILLFSNMLPHRSLNNASDKIRWTLDLRWLSGDLPSDFHGIKSSIKLRSADDPNMTIDWESFDAINRHQAAETDLGVTLDDLDPILCGPWMKKWEMSNTNRHTIAFDKMEKAGLKIPVYSP